MDYSPNRTLLQYCLFFFFPLKKWDIFFYLIHVSGKSQNPGQNEPGASSSAMSCHPFLPSPVTFMRMLIFNNPYEQKQMLKEHKQIKNKVQRGLQITGWNDTLQVGSGGSLLEPPTIPALGWLRQKHCHESSRVNLG